MLHTTHSVASHLVKGGGSFGVSRKSFPESVNSTAQIPLRGFHFVDCTQIPARNLCKNNYDTKENKFSLYQNTTTNRKGVFAWGECGLFVVAERIRLLWNIRAVLHNVEKLPLRPEGVGGEELEIQ